jgi:hypothetical protein
MSYIGNRPDVLFQVSSTEYDYYSGDNVSTLFYLSRQVSANADIQVVVNNVVQSPGVAYYVRSLTELIFSEPPSTGTDNIYVIYRQYLQSGLVPGENTVIETSIQNGAVTTNKLGVISQLNITGNTTTQNLTVSENTTVPDLKSLQVTSPNRHSIRPSLLLDFANSKALDSRITFTRASTATFYDGKTVAKAEENLLLQSQTFETTWPPINTTVTANSTTAPDGTSTADTLTATANTAAHLIFQTTTGSSGNDRVFSVFAKKDTHDYIQLSFNGYTTHFVNFDINTGVVGTVNGAGSSASIVDVGNGWYRCVYVYPSAAESQLRIGLVTSTTAVRVESWTAAGTETIFLWGAQLEQRSAVTAYTATTTQPITNYIPALQTAASGVARFEHNPITGESLGLEIEEQRTNLFTYSDDFANTAWGKTDSTVTSNTIVAPDGTFTGDKLITNSSATSGRVNNSLSITIGVAYTLSCFAKKGETDILNLFLSDGVTGRSAEFNLTTGAVSGTPSAGLTANITSAGNGWYRCAVTVASPAGTVGSMRIRQVVTTGDGYSGIYIWGAQLEAGAFVTSYIPTVASQVTRSADAASMTGTNFSSWYRADEGSIYSDYLGGSGNASRRFFSINDGTTSNFIRGIASNAAGSVSNYGEVTVNGTSQAQLGASGAYSATPQKFAIAYAVNNIAVSKNGASAITDSSALIPVVSKLDIGFDVNTAFLNGTIKKLAYYPKRLTNEELQGLTTQ